MTYEGKKLEYSPEWSGPLKNRSCTDWPCLAFFVVFMIFWVGVGIYALACGNIEVLVAPTDSQGRQCGLDSEVIDEPNLVFFDLTECLNTGRVCQTPQVCRKECPSSTWISSSDWKGQSLDYIQKNIICETGIDVKNQTKEQLYSLMQENKCAKWVLESTPVLRRCVPKSIPSELIGENISEEDFNEARKFSRGGTFLTAAISTRGPVLGLITAGAAVCLLYIFFLKQFAFEIVILSAINLCGFFSYVSYYFFERYKDENVRTWLVSAILFAIIAGLILVIVFCLWDKIRLACRLIEEASKAVMSIWSSLLFPLFPWLLHLSSIVYAVVIGLYLSTIETEKTSQIVLAFLIIHVIGFVWLYCFITALGEIILAGTFATWYWTFKKSDVPGFVVATSAWTSVRYHLGTVAFGSMLITICRLIRYTLQVAKRSVRSEAGLCCIICIACGACFMTYLEAFVKFMNRNAYIICAVYGKGLVSSASDALGLIVRNALRVVVLNNMVSWLLWMGKVGIAVVMSIITWSHFTSTEHGIEFWWVPVIFVFLGAYLVANVFLDVYEVAVDTIFLCFLEDSERNDGSLARPYYMSSELRTLLHKDF